MRTVDVPRRVLVSEDDPAARIQVVRVLLAEGCRVTVCEDGQSALQAVDRGGYDLVVVGALLPDATGVEVLYRLRGRDREVPAILLTGSLAGRLTEACAVIGRVEIVAKPFTAEGLRRAAVRLSTGVAVSFQE